MLATTTIAPMIHASPFWVCSFTIYAYPAPAKGGEIRYPCPMSDEQSPMEVLKATRPWWIIPIVILFILALVLVFTDVAPLKNFAYTVF